MTENIDKFFEEIEKLKQAAELLERIFAEIGPYNQLSAKLNEDIIRFFKFDDSE